MTYHLSRWADRISLEVFKKKSQATPVRVIDACRDRIKRYDKAVRK